MSPDAVIPMCPAVIRCALMLVSAVCIVLFNGGLVQFVVRTL